MGQGRNTNTIMEISAAITKHLSFIVRISTSHSNNILVNLVSWLFHALKTLANHHDIL